MQVPKGFWVLGIGRYNMKYRLTSIYTICAALLWNHASYIEGGGGGVCQHLLLDMPTVWQMTKLSIKKIYNSTINMSLWIRIFFFILSLTAFCPCWPAWRKTFSEQIKTSVCRNEEIVLHFHRFFCFFFKQMTLLQDWLKT